MFHWSVLEYQSANEILKKSAEKAMKRYQSKPGHSNQNQVNQFAKHSPKNEKFQNPGDSRKYILLCFNPMEFIFPMLFSMVFNFDWSLINYFIFGSFQSISCYLVQI